MKLSSLLAELGNTAFEKFRDASGPKDVVTPIRDGLVQLQALNEEILELSESGKGLWITPKRLAIVGAVAACLLVMIAIVKVGKATPGESDTVGSRSSSTT